MRRTSDGGGGDVATAPVPAAAMCSPLAKIVNVPGTANIGAGYRMRNLPTRKFKPIPLAEFVIHDDGKDHESESDRERKLLESIHMQERNWNKKIIRKSIEREVALAMEAYDEDMEVRRDRLRELLLREEGKFTRELVASSRKAEEERAAELAARAAEAVKEREEERKQLLRNKQLQRYIEASHELRDAKSKAWIEDRKKANLAQITENEELRRYEMEDTAFWNALMRDYCEVEEAKDASKAKKRAELERLGAKELLHQMEVKSQRPPDGKDFIDVNGIGPYPYGKPKEEELSHIYNQKQQTRKDLEMQINESKENLNKRIAEERAVDHMCGSLDIQDKGIITREEREARNREILIYMESMKEFRDAIAKREKEADEYIRQLVADKEAKRREMVRQAKEEKKQLYRELKCSWDRQHESKLIREFEDHEKDRLEAAEAAIAYEAELKTVKAHHKQKARDYGLELKAQQMNIGARRAEEQRKLDEYFEKQEDQRKREEAQLAREVLAKGLAIMH